jgi:hypothetical protein
LLVVGDVVALAAQSPAGETAGWLESLTRTELGALSTRLVTQSLEERPE